MISIETKKAYTRLASLIHRSGESFQKKHGSWDRMKLYDDLWLIMDSWNQSIKIVKGNCDYDNMYTGFINYEKLDYLGIDFGGFECRVDANRLNYYHALASCHSSDIK